MPGLRGHGASVRLEGLRDPGKDLLESTPTDGHLVHCGTKGVHQTAPVPVRPRPRAHERAEPGAVAHALCGRHRGCGPTATVATPALMP